MRRSSPAFTYSPRVFTTTSTLVGSPASPRTVVFWCSSSHLPPLSLHSYLTSFIKISNFLSPLSSSIYQCRDPVQGNTNFAGLTRIAVLLPAFPGLFSVLLVLFHLFRCSALPPYLFALPFSVYRCYDLVRGNTDPTRFARVRGLSPALLGPFSVLLASFHLLYATSFCWLSSWSISVSAVSR